MIDRKERLLSALNRAVDLESGFIYRLSWEDYTFFPEPFPRTRFTVQEVQERILRYPNPERPGELFAWDIHGRLLIPETISIPDVAVVVIHGGAANEDEFLFTPDGPEDFADFTTISPTAVRVGIVQHIASLGVPVLVISLPGHYRREAWPPMETRQPEFIIGETLSLAEISHRLAVYTFRMCVEAVKVLIERALPGYGIYIWGHSTGGEFLFLMEQYGLRNNLLGAIGFGTGTPANIRKEWCLLYKSDTFGKAVERLSVISGLSRRTPKIYEGMGHVGPNQPWGSTEDWFRLVEKRRPMFKPFLQTIEHQAYDMLYEEVRRRSGLPEDELFITYKADLNRLQGKKLLFFVGELDRGHWIGGAEHGVEGRFEVFGLQRLARYANEVRLVVIPCLTHYGHIEGYNECLARLMVTGLKDYFRL